MTDSPPHDARAALIPGAHRLVRMLGEHEGPFRGALVTRGSDVAVSVDAERFAGWDAWQFAGAEHVAGPLDVVRREDGHDVLLPWCTERVSVFVGRRRAAGDALSLGEIGTVAASLVRGVREIGVRPSAGEWWLADDGRPLFVFCGGPSARESAATLIVSLADDVTDRAAQRVLDAIEHGLRQTRVGTGEEERWESELFEIAAPRALAIEPVRVAIEERGELRHQHDVASGSAAQRPVRDRTPQPLSVLAALLDGVSRSVHGRVHTWRQPRHGRDETGATRRSRPPASESERRVRTAPSRSRRRSLLVAGGAAMAVLCAGALWPQQNQTHESSESGATPMPSVAPSPSAASAAEPSPEPASTGESQSNPEDPVAMASKILAAIDECVRTGDEVCGGAVASGSTAVLADVADSPVEAGSATLLDDYGDLAVIRVGERDGDDRILVLVRQEQVWLARDIYDAADQPE